jgi:hypothetical protein
MKLYKDSYNKFWIENETSPSGIYSITFSEDNSICVIRNIRSGLIRYNGLVTGLKKENGTNYTNRVDLENAVSDFFRKASTAPIAETRGLEQYSTLTNLPTIGSDSVVYYTIDTKLLYVWNGTAYDAVPEQEIPDYVTVVANYAALPDPTTVIGKFYWCSNSQGTSWLPGTIGGTYYNSGLYYSNGTTWEYLNVPYQATIAEVNAGTVTDKFLTPKTFNDSSKIVDAVTTTKKVTTLTTNGGQLTGFLYPELVDVSYNGLTRKITLIGNIESAFRGIPMTDIIPSFISGWMSEAHADVDGEYFLYFNGTSFVWSTTPWDFKQLMIAFVYRDGVNVCLRECHGLQDWQSHEANHNNVGTVLRSGADVAGFTLSSETATNRRPTVSQALVYDEDLPSTLPALTNGLYTRLFLDGANNANFETDKADILEHTVGNRFQYNLFTGGVWTKATAANNQYAKIFLMAIPTTSDADCQKSRFVWIMPQTVNATLLTIQALTPATLNLGQIGTALAEYVFVQEFIVRATANNWVIISASKLIGNKRFQSVSSGNFLSSVSTDSTITGDGTVGNPLSVAHNNTTGIQGGAVGDYQHVTSAEKASYAPKDSPMFSGYIYTNTASATADTVNDRREIVISGVKRFERCTGSNAAKGGGSWAIDISVDSTGVQVHNNSKVWASNSGAYYLQFQNPGTNTFDICGFNGIRFLYGIGTELFRYNSSGRILINTTSDNLTDRLQVNGTAANTTGVWATLSDERLKTEIAEIDNPIDKVLRIANATRQFRFIDEEKYAKGQRTGYIAQLLRENGLSGHVTERDPQDEVEGALFRWEYGDSIEKVYYTDTDKNDILDENGELAYSEKITRVPTVIGEKVLGIENNFAPYLFPAIAVLVQENNDLKARLTAIEKHLGLC